MINCATVWGCWPFKGHPQMIRWRDSAMLSHEPLSVVYSGINTPDGSITDQGPDGRSFDSGPVPRCAAWCGSVRAIRTMRSQLDRHHGRPQRPQRPDRDPRKGNKVWDAAEATREGPQQPDMETCRGYRHLGHSRRTEL